VSQYTVRVLLAAAFSGIGALAVYRLGRQGKLSFRYTIGWLGLCCVGVFAGVFIPLLEPLADAFEVSPAAILAVGAILLLVAICVQLSVSISGLQEQNRRLSEEIALRERERDDRP
jgi:hypothetical protein